MTLGRPLNPDLAVAAGLGTLADKRALLLRRLSKKQIEPGEELGNCGHVEAGDRAWLFDGLWESKDRKIFWLAVCEACLTKAKFDLSKIVVARIDAVGAETELTVLEGGKS